MPEVFITFAGEQTIRTIGESLEYLRRGLSEGDDLIIDCSGVEEVDITFLQLLLAARKSAVTRNRTLRLAAPARGRLLDCLRAAAILPEGDQPDNQHSWMTEGDQ